MNITGIICEYNPFHNGHAFHIEETRRKTGADAAIVCVMSGNFVQRGEAALFRKQARVKAALASGADLVIELPLPWATGSAGRFAAGAVHILNSFGIPMSLSFGSEHGDADALSEIAVALISPAADSLITENLSLGLSYADAQQKAADALLGENAGLLKSPNNLLGIEYIKAIISQKAPITPLAVKRLGVDHDSDDSCGGFASASLIRSEILSGADVSHYVSGSCLEIYNEEINSGFAPVVISEEPVLYRLRTMSSADFAALPDSSEGLSNRLAKFAASENTVADILEKAKTKRYAFSRLRRMVLAAYLGVTAEVQNDLPPYIRVLGANPTGQKVLREIKATASLPIITKPASAKNLTGFGKTVFELEAKASDIYSLSYPNGQRQGGSEWTSSPVMIK